MAGSATRTVCQLYLVVEVHDAARILLPALLERASIASLLLTPGKRGPLTAAVVQPLLTLAQARGVATLLLDDARLARTVGADGAHLTAGGDVLGRYREARDILGGRAIVGAEAGGSRHAAMELGEAGADYLAFGPEVSQAVPSAEAADVPEAPRTQDELIAWWSEVFEVPCVAFGASDEAAARELAHAGADFVAVSCPVGQPAAAAIAWFDRMRAAVETADA